jgi:hypothetical protein
MAANAGASIIEVNGGRILIALRFEDLDVDSALHNVSRTYH